MHESMLYNSGLHVLGFDMRKSLINEKSGLNGWSSKLSTSKDLKSIQNATICCWWSRIPSDRRRDKFLRQMTRVFRSRIVENFERRSLRVSLVEEMIEIRVSAFSLLNICFYKKRHFYEKLTVYQNLQFTFFCLHPSSLGIGFNVNAPMLPSAQVPEIPWQNVD